MANKTVYPYGTEGQLPSSIGIINDLETGGADKALSAEQGVVLDKKIGDIPYIEREIDLVALANNLGCYINYTQNQWADSNNSRSFFVPINPGGKYRITGKANSTPGRYAILKSRTDTSGTTPDYATGESAVRFVGAGKTVEFVAPDDAYYLSVNKTLSSENILPDRLVEVVLNTKTEDDISVLRGEFDEKVDYSTLQVSSNGTSAITITKEGDGIIKVIDKNPTGSKYALIRLPDSLVVGKKYLVSFDCEAVSLSSYWALTVCDSSYSNPHGGKNIQVGFSGHYSFSLTLKDGDAYLRLASLSQRAGAYVIIKNLSISEDRTTVADLSRRVKAIEEDEGSSDMENMLRQARYVLASPTIQPLALLHFTDIHGDTVAANQIKNFLTKYAEYIDDSVQTGDAVYYYYNSDGQGYQWYQQNGIPEALFVLGNHDGCSNDSSKGWVEGAANWDYMGKEWDFDTYFAPYISTRGVTPPAGYDDSSSPYYKACYWHKDYSSAKVRVIGLDCMHFNDTVRYTSNDQETWLAAKLAETLDSGNAAYGFSVVFLCHYPLDDYSGSNETWNDTNHRFTFNQNEGGGHVMDSNTQRPVNCHYGTSFTAEARFSMRDRIGTVGSKNYTKGNNNPIADVIQSWMNSGGKYLAWLSGHTHTEYMYYPAKYPDMLVIGLPQAGSARGNSQADRSEDSPMHPCANFILFDTENKYIKIVRFGKTLDRHLVRFEKLGYDYENRETFRP